jgi:hypothetical protein
MCVASLFESHTKTIDDNIFRRGPPSPWIMEMSSPDPIRCHPRQTCHRPFKYSDLKGLVFAAENSLS